MKNALIICLTLLPLYCFSQVFGGGGGPIADDGTHSYYPLEVSGMPNAIDHIFGLETVCINLTHTWNDDLVISLIAPDGTEIELSSRNGGDSDNYSITCFNYDAPTPIYQAWGPFSGTFQPEGFMSAINNGQNPNGTWTLHIFDVYPFADTGELTGWALEFGNEPAIPFPFAQAKLPLVVISTQGQIIPNEPKIMARMKVIDNGPGQPNLPTDSANVYDGWAGIEIRGHSSAWMPKKTFSIETRDADSSGVDVPLLGMPENEDWVLTANYSDKTMLRNAYAYHLYRKMDRWAARTAFCELVIDGEYQGIYVLGERIKRGADRVPIASISYEDTTGTELTGGYIFKIDWEDPGDIGWNSEYPAINATGPLRYLFEYPKPENTHPAHVEYIKSYVDSFELAMQSPLFADPDLGWRRFADEDSFIDYIILSELTKNVDGYRLSTFLYKDKEGKINAGPPWDYDLAWGNADYSEGWLPTGWNYISQGAFSNQCPFWWQKFFADQDFQDRLACRWQELRQGPLDLATINAEFDSLSAVLSVSTDLNFTKWPILGVYVWPNPSPIPQDYPGEIAKIKSWIQSRINWLDSHWPGNCAPNAAGEPQVARETWRIVPNPNGGAFAVEAPGIAPDSPIRISNLAGKVVYEGIIGDGRFQLGLPPGIYFLSGEDAQGQKAVRFVIE